jgi:chitin disaccharide deacetylase
MVEASGRGRFVKEETAGHNLIVNADDFGLTEGINRGIVETHERGIVTSASLMVRYPAAESAAEYARVHPKLSVGLHFELEESRYRSGKWEVAYRVVDPADVRAVRLEFEHQLALFERLLAHPPTHLDSHQHVHLAEPARTIMLEYAERLNIPLRSCASSIAYCGSFYGQTDEGESLPRGISIAAFIRAVESLPTGWIEMGCHPGHWVGLDSVYTVEREEELQVLSSAALREALEKNKVELCSFHDFNSRSASCAQASPPSS